MYFLECDLFSPHGEEGESAWKEGDSNGGKRGLPVVGPANGVPDPRERASLGEGEQCAARDVQS